jgi:hypothetical protein
MTTATQPGNLSELAPRYLAGGLSLVPCSAETKRPDNRLLPRDEAGRATWAPYQQNPPSEDTLRGWFSHGCKSIAGIGGRVSGGLWILDFDEPRFYPAWLEQVGALADGLPTQQTGGGGYQVWLRCPDPGRNDKLAWAADESEETGRRIAIETRGEGGYAIMPGSLHPSGNTYRAIAGDFANIPTVPQAVADALLAAARKRDEAPFTRQQLAAREKNAKTSTKYHNESNGQGSVIDAYNARVSIAEALEQHGYTHSGERYVRPGGKTPSVAVRDGRSFHHSSNDSLSDGFWHKSFDVFCHYAHGDDCGAAVRAAAELLGLQAPAAKTANNASDGGERRKPIDYHFMTCADLVAAKFDIRFLVEGIMAAGQPLIIAGPQKALKTSVALDMAFSLATAGHFLGRFKVPEPVAVGFMSGESGGPTLAETARRIARAAGYDPAGVRNLIISDRVAQIGSPDHLAAIDLVILEHALEVLFIDPVFMAMDGADAGNLFIQGQILRRVSELCQDRGCTLVLLHHVKKGSGNDYQPLELSSIAWAGFAEAARQWALLNRREPYEPGSGLHHLHLSVGGSAGHGGYWGLDVDEGTYHPGVDRLWNVSVLAADEVRTSNRDQRQEQRKAKADGDLDADRREIVGVAVKLNTPESKTAIRERCQCGHARFGRAFASLVGDGVLQEATVTKPNGQTYGAWKVRNDQET